MKYICKKSISICIFSFLSVSFVWTQDSESLTDTLRMYIGNAQYRQAIEYIDQAEPTKELLYQKALCCKYLNDYSNAIEVLDTLSEEYPDDIPVKMQLASCYEDVAQYAKSIDCYNRLLRIDSTNTYFEVRKADLLYRSEKYALALDGYNRIDSTYNPNYITRRIAMCYEKMNQQDIAKLFFKKAWDLDSLDAYSAGSFIKIQVKEEDFFAAYVSSEQYIKNDTTNATINALNAFVYYNLGHYDVAIQRFKKCLLQGDSSLIVNRSLGFSYYLTKEDSLARPYLQQASLQDTIAANVLDVLGKVNLKLGYYQEAIECFSNLIKRELESIPKNSFFYDVYYDMATAYEKNEEYNSAVEFYLNTLSYLSYTPESNNNRMALYYKIATLSDEKLNDYATAIAYYKLYRSTLLNYQKSLENEKEINEVESKLTALDEYIRQLTETEGKKE